MQIVGHRSFMQNEINARGKGSGCCKEENVCMPHQHPQFPAHSYDKAGKISPCI